jgi:hypothetical protein
MQEHACIDLTDDRRDNGFDGDDGNSRRPDALHYAPTDHDGIRQRVAAVSDWIARKRPSLMVIDVSCEVAMLARLASVPTVVVRLGGDRRDEPHLQAFRAARSIVSPFAKALDDPATPGWVREKTVYCPGIVERPNSAPVEEKSILVVLGQGGPVGDGTIWSRAARAMPDWNWRVAGPCSSPAQVPPNLTLLGWVRDVPERIARAEVVVGSAGDGVVGTVLAARRPFVCMPEDRPFGEQVSKAAGLVGTGAAILCTDPSTATWRTLISEARRLSPDAAAALDDPQGADRLGQYLLVLADEGNPA